MVQITNIEGTLEKTTQKVIVGKEVNITKKTKYI